MAEKEAKKEAKKAAKPVAKKDAEKKPRFSLRRKVKGEQKEQPVVERKITRALDPLSVLNFVLMTEKSIRMIEAENKLIFIVNRKASKNDIAAAFEKSFSSKVAEVRVQNDQKGRKRAVIRLQTPGAAGEIAIRLGII